METMRQLSIHHYKQNPKHYFLFQLEIFLIEMQALGQKQLKIQIPAVDAYSIFSLIFVV